jgi:hypothetical protein
VHRWYAPTRSPRIPRAPVQDHLDHLGDHVARAAHPHGVADAHVLAVDLVLVVERRAADRDPGDVHRLEHGDRGQLSGAPDLDGDIHDLRDLDPRRELERHRPARRARAHAQQILPVATVDLHDRAVDLVVQPVALLEQLRVVFEHRIEPVAEADVLLDAETPAAQRIEHLPLGLERQAIVRGDVVGEEIEPARGGDLRIELTHGAGRRVARVRERFLVLLDQPLVQRLELGDEHQCLAPHRERLRTETRGAVAGEAQRQGADRPQVLGDVLADLAVAASRSAHEHAFLVHQLDREPVELGLGHVRDALDLERLAHPAVELAHLVGLHERVEGEHRPDVGDFLERGAQLAAHPLGRRVGGAQIRKLLLERLELPEQPVVLRV